MADTFSIGNSVYIKAKVIAKDEEIEGRYCLQTATAKFFSDKSKDDIVFDPDQDTVTASQLYNILKRISAFSAKEFSLAFPGYSSVDQIIKDDKDYPWIITQYRSYLSDNEANVGDIVKFTKSSKDDGDTIIEGAIILVNEGDTPINNVYVVYEPKYNDYYTVTRTDITKTGKRASISSLLSKIDKTISDAILED